MASAYTPIRMALTVVKTTQPTPLYAQSVWKRLQNSTHEQTNLNSNLNWSEALLPVKCRNSNQTPAFAPFLCPPLHVVSALVLPP